MNFLRYNKPTIVQSSKKANTLVDLVFQMEGSHVIASRDTQTFAWERQKRSKPHKPVGLSTKQKQNKSSHCMSKTSGEKTWRGCDPNEEIVINRGPEMFR